MAYCTLQGPFVLVLPSPWVCEITNTKTTRFTTASTMHQLDNSIFNTNDKRLINHDHHTLVISFRFVDKKAEAASKILRWLNITPSGV